MSNTLKANYDDTKAAFEAILATPSTRTHIKIGRGIGHRNITVFRNGKTAYLISCGSGFVGIADYDVATGEITGYPDAVNALKKALAGE